MVTSGTPSPILVSQKRLTFYCISMGLIGLMSSILLWWDSTISYTRIEAGSYALTLVDSAVLCASSPDSIKSSDIHFQRDQLQVWFSTKSLFPSPEVSSTDIFIPIYLLILTYLATLLLIWIVLMNRLARRDFTKAISIPKEE